MPAAGCGCALPVHPTSKSAKASPYSPRCAAGNSACRRESRMWSGWRAAEFARWLSLVSPQMAIDPAPPANGASTLHAAIEMLSLVSLGHLDEAELEI